MIKDDFPASKFDTMLRSRLRIDPETKPPNGNTHTVQHDIIYFKMYSPLIVLRFSPDHHVA